MKAVIYARYSSDNQREESIEGQIRECMAFAEKNDITVLKHYIDRAYSARTDHRPAFQEMIKDSDKHLFDMVIVWKLDRFSRDRYDSARYKVLLKKNNVRVVSATEVISSGADGILLESVLEGFAEYYSAVGGDKNDAFDNYAFYGGMPLVLSRPTDKAKMNYLATLFSEVYIKDIVERRRIKREDILSAVLDLLCSSVGSLTNPTNIANSLNSKQKLKGEGAVANNTVKQYIDNLTDAYLFSECRRYDVRGKGYFDYPNKYYCEDIGLRNARIGFRQQEMTHIMENIIYNELIIRDCMVDVGVVYSSEKDDNGKLKQVAREIDFIANDGEKKLYIQSAFALPDEEKTMQENKPFSLTGDYFPKIIVRYDITKRWYNESGVLNIGIVDFLLDDSII